MARHCRHTGCVKQPSHGMAGIKKVETCKENAVNGMVDVRNKGCGHPYCSKQPTFGAVGSKQAEVCAEHASDGMVNVVTKRCSHPNYYIPQASVLRHGWG